MSHYIERWECGHVASQCRCPGPKEERTRPGKCSTCAAQVSAMPERVWLWLGPQWGERDTLPWSAWPAEDPNGGSVCYIPESRLLAAEARVREVEAEMRIKKRQLSDMEDRAFTCERVLAPIIEERNENGAEARTLRAERDALVELVRDVACSGVAFEDKRLDYVEIQIDTDTWAQARAILARETNDG